MIEEGIYQWLKQNTAIQAAVANTAKPSAQNIFMGFVPESASMPCIMFEKVSSVHDTTLDGPSTYVIRRYQFNCYGQDLENIPGSGYVSAQKVADVLRQQLNGLTGTLPDGTLLFNAILDDETYNAIQDYFIHFQQI
jgi:hypothetical protein